MGYLYLAADGDDVGRKIEFFIVTNQMESLSRFFKNFQSAMIWLESILSQEFNANIVFNGGDSLLASIEIKELTLDKLEVIRIKFSEFSKATLSFGIGNNPRQAYFALKLAKASGKNRTEIFQEQ